MWTVGQTSRDGDLIATITNPQRLGGGAAPAGGAPLAAAAADGAGGGSATRSGRREQLVRGLRDDDSDDDSDDEDGDDDDGEVVPLKAMYDLLLAAGYDPARSDAEIMCAHQRQHQLCGAPCVLSGSPTRPTCMVVLYPVLCIVLCIAAAAAAAISAAIPTTPAPCAERS